GWNTSGAVEYDEKGRIVKEGMPEFVTGTLEELLQTQPIMKVKKSRVASLRLKIILNFEFP
ncbi:MAG: hypothetical protein IKJ96_06825, partial [Alistipes sp.]|nr:hypothetical protein [Alistipes sp.]